MDDIKLITLYKQQYRSEYRETLDSDYSCWGYYDGIDICDVTKNGDDSLFSSIWKASEASAGQMKGRFCEQTIGIFRIGEERCLESTKQTYPFMGLSLIQLEKGYEEVEIIDKIESIDEKTPDNGKVETYCYLTFDNASIICLKFSDSLKFLSESISRMENIPEIRYNYAIFSAGKDFLAYCTNQERIDSSWKYDNDTNDSFGLDDKIYNLAFRINYSGISGLSDIIDEAFGKWDAIVSEKTGERWHPVNGYQGARYYKKQGHVNYTAVIPESDVKTLVSLVLNGGPITHQSSIYKRKKTCGIETSFAFEEESADMGKRAGYGLGLDALSEAHIENKLSWSEREIKKYADLAADAFMIDDYGTYAAYNGLVRTLNSISQYENYDMGKSLFYIIYPSFDMFENLLKYTASIRDGRESDIREIIRERIRKYVLQLNDVLYHTIHTEQVYLTLPGFSGTSYSISQKLLTFYSWFGTKLTELLNDGSQHKYRTMITPVVEEVCQAKYIDFGTDDIRDRLLHVKISQRAMSYPDNTFIILTHEIAHYVGDSQRTRRFRAGLLCRAVSQLMSECRCALRGALSIDVEEVVVKAYEEALLSLREELAVSYYEHLEQRFMTVPDNKEFYYEPYFLDLEAVASKKILGNTDQLISRTISKERLGQKLSLGEQNIFLTAVHEWTKDGRRNAEEFVSSGLLKEMIIFVKDLFREVYSDVVSMVVLQCSVEDFYNSFEVSEGESFDMDKQNQQVLLRKYIVTKVFGEIDGEGFSDNTLRTENMLPADEVYRNLYKFSWLRKLLEKYARVCKKELENFLNEEDQNKKVELLRSVYKGITKENEDNALAVFQVVTDCNKAYEKEIETCYQLERGRFESSENL